MSYRIKGRELKMNREINTASGSVPPIRRIDVKDLFGSHSYCLKPTGPIDGEPGRLMLLYGRNGTGKTTILNLLYHLLNPEPFGGHRSFIGGIPFREFSVHLHDNSYISALRGRKIDAGNYMIKARLSRVKREIVWAWAPTRPQSQRRNDPIYESLCSSLRNLDLTTHYLRDTRRVEGSISKKGRVSRRMVMPSPEDVVLSVETEEAEEMLNPARQLQESIDAAIQWFRRNALEAANVGYTSINAIYRDILTSLSKPSKSIAKVSFKSVDQLIESIKELQSRNETFAQLGLTPELDISGIAAALKSGWQRRAHIINAILRPYLDGQKARLDALQELQRVMSSFVSLLSSFYSGKDVSLQLDQGLEIRTKQGQVISPQLLSSGEKQLLLLFCNAISSRSKKTILMIDEPELSLNVTWQRELIPALLTCMSGTGYQIVLATHSVELLSQYQESVISLDEKAL